jgi:hypothetical protein
VEGRDRDVEGLKESRKDLSEYTLSYPDSDFFFFFLYRDLGPKARPVPR